jgi:hypothetical protein
MANKSLITYGSKISQVEQVYYSPVAVVPPNITVPISSMYCFLAKVDAWPNNNNPPVPAQDVKALKTIYKNTFAVKHITSNDISPVIKRVNWESGTVYDTYSDEVDMFELDVNGNLVKKFYIKNRYDQVFKCLWNDNDADSTVEPYFEPGTFSTNNIFQGADHYKWKYMFTIDSGSKLKFMDATWIPVPVGTNIPNALQSNAGAGNIDVINVLDGGALYDPSNSAITVTITGDGTGASATAVVVGNAITDVIMNTTGTNYTYANVSFTTTAGFGAIAKVPVSPVGGHGFDPISELGCKHVMISAEFKGGESGIIPTDIDYHQVGIINNPTTKSLVDTYGTDYVPATGSIYKTTTDFVVAPGFGVYVADEQFYQGDSPETASFIGNILSFDVASNVVRVLNMSGTPTLNAPIKGYTSTTTRTLLAYSEPDFSIHSGYISIIENRSGVTRSTDGIEQYKFVLGY